MQDATSPARALRRRGEGRPSARHWVSPLLRVLTRARSQSCFIQIGANEDPIRNPLPEAVRRDRWRGVIADPIPAVAEGLRAAYADLPGVSIEQAAIAGTDDGDRAFYYDPTEDAPEDGALSSFTGSLRREVLYLAPNYRPGIDERVVELNVQCLTFETLCRRHQAAAVDVVRIDTDGEEPGILRQIDLRRFHPSLICFSHRLLGPGVRAECLSRLAAHGYQTLADENETWAFSARSVRTHHAVLLRALWLWLATIRPRTQRLRSFRRSRGEDRPVTFPLTHAERRYLTLGYDDRVPLPPSAETYLSPANQRLAELRRDYAALTLPAVRHHMWSEGRVADHVDLRHFRGDNLYVWHHPEHPRAMALKLFTYARYLESHGGGALLAQLDEDGTFGCWTAEVHGYGNLSRDLLDSVNEILFLDRHLRVLSAASLRVLDIGAGYGRLAHRMAAAVPGLKDYCCIDAVAESTFLAEYYLRFRSSCPPARVTPLTRVGDLHPGSFDLAVNVHSFSECTLEAVTWWVGELRRLEVPRLFVVPNEADGILTKEADGSYHSVLPVLESAGYQVIAKERAISDRAVRETALLNDNYYLFSLER